jgi:hypothetical protein
MKRFLAYLGVVFLIVVAAVAILIGYAAVTGSKLDASSRAYVDEAIPKIVAAWSADEMLHRAAPQMLQSVTEAQLRELFARFAAKLGPLVSYAGSKGQSLVSIMLNSGRVVSAEYTAHVVFEHGLADIKALLFQGPDERWSIAGFHVNSPVLLK